MFDNYSVRGTVMFDQKGMARAVVLLAVIATALLIAIVVPVVRQRTDAAAKDMEDLYEQAAKDDAYLVFVQEGKSFTAIYDSENKRFVDERSSSERVNPYGVTKEHEGMILIVTVDTGGNIKTRWSKQK